MADDDLLQSWKEIAAYLERSERTCRRWETEFGLPVHRMDGSVRGSVFAYKTELDRWMDEVLHEKTRDPPSKKGLVFRPIRIVVLALAVVLVGAASLWLVRDDRSKPPLPASTPNPTLAILPFTNNSGDENLDFWENALADLLVSDLDQSRYLRVFPQDRLLGILHDLGLLGDEGNASAKLAEIAARTKAENLVVGYFVKAGQRFRISATIRQVDSGETVVLPSIEARNEGEILRRVDELSASIKNQLVSPLTHSEPDLDLELGTITTSSLEAYRHFVEGRVSWADGRANDAMKSFEKAVAIDPEFAMAHNWLAYCYTTLPGFEDQAEQSRARAFEFSDHASPRERYYIRGQYYMYRGRGSWGKALETFSEFVTVYPDDELALLRLGYLYLRTEKWGECVDTFERLNDSREGSSHITHLSDAYRALGQYDQALEVAKLSPSDEHSHRFRLQLARNLIIRREFRAALQQADEMLARVPGNVSALMVKGDIHLYRREWDQAESCYRELLSPVGREQSRLRSRINGMRRLVYLHLAMGQSGEALGLISQIIDEVDAVEEGRWLPVLQKLKAYVLTEQREFEEANAVLEKVMADVKRRHHVTGVISTLHDLGLVALEMGYLPRAKEAAAEMRSEIDGWINPSLMRGWHSLEGYILLAEGNPRGAASHFEKAVALLPYQHNEGGDSHAWYFSSLAHAYYLSGEVEIAQEWYEKTLALTSGRLVYGSIYAKSHFVLGKIYERRGMRAEAIRSYRAYLDLWREADFKTTEIDEAERSLSALLG